MKAMVLKKPGEPLVAMERAMPEPGAGQVRVRVLACGVCRTDLHVVDGDLPRPRLPVVPGHEVVGEVDAVGPRVDAFGTGQRVGVPWLGRTCGNCAYCREGRENLCDRPGFTGYTLDGGYADCMLADARYCFPLLAEGDATALAPLLCAGLIGYRSYRMAGEAETLGLYGFGAAAHILCQLATAEGRRVFAFTRPGDAEGQAFARRMGADWAGDSDTAPPEPLDAAILFAPVGALVPESLQRVRKGGVVVCAGIHMSDIPSFPYRWLWEERRLRSVANLTRADGRALFEAVARHPVETQITRYSLDRANEALSDLREGRIEGAAVLIPGQAGVAT